MLMTAEGKSILLVPILEREHAEERKGVIDELITYPEYPGERHPMKYLKDVVKKAGLKGKKIGVDSNGYPGGYGYIGPKLSEVVDTEVIEVKNLIEEMMRVKSAEEIKLIRESVKWGNLAHSLLQEYTKPGLSETDISIRASYKASLAMIKALGPSYKLTRADIIGLPAFAAFRGQVGARTAIPHAITTNATIERGDILITGAGADIGGYGSELERTMIVGQPTEKQKKFFNLMLEAQNVAMEMIRPGNKCSDVDRAVREVFEKEGLKEYWRHHTGHSLGIRMHEAPFFDIGDNTIIEPGMVFSVEPGIYIPGFAGFRHSDTVVVTESGIEMLTYYPRELDSLVID